MAAIASDWSWKSGNWDPPGYLQVNCVLVIDAGRSSTKRGWVEPCRPRPTRSGQGSFRQPGYRLHRMAFDQPAGSYDVLILGGGPAATHCAGFLADAGRHVAIVEDELLGGECDYYACIPSKTLLRPGEALAAALDAPGASERVTDGPIAPGGLFVWRDFMVNGYDDGHEVALGRVQGGRDHPGPRSPRRSGRRRRGGTPARRARHHRGNRILSEPAARAGTRRPGRTLEQP